MVFSGPAFFLPPPPPLSAFKSVIAYEQKMVLQNQELQAEIKRIRTEVQSEVQNYQEKLKNEALALTSERNRVAQLWSRIKRLEKGKKVAISFRPKSEQGSRPMSSKHLSAIRISSPSGLADPNISLESKMTDLIHIIESEQSQSRQLCDELDRVRREISDAKRANDGELSGDVPSITEVKKKVSQIRQKSNEKLKVMSAENEELKKTVKLQNEKLIVAKEEQYKLYKRLSKIEQERESLSAAQVQQKVR